MVPNFVFGGFVVKKQLDQAQAQSQTRKNAYANDYAEAYEKYKKIYAGSRARARQQQRIADTSNSDVDTDILTSRQNEQEGLFRKYVQAMDAAEGRERQTRRIMDTGDEFGAEPNANAQALRDGWQSSGQRARQAAARQNALQDQARGQQRTAYELGKQLDQMEKARDYQLAQQADDPDGLPQFKGAYDAVNAGREKPMTLTEMETEIGNLQYRKSKLEKSVKGRVGEYAVDLGRGVFKGGFEQWATGFESAMGYLEQGANGAAAWVLRDLAKAVPDGSLKSKMLSLANDFESYWTGESTTEHELAQRYAEAYEGCYGAEDIDAYVEEICADAYAGMDRLPEAKTEIMQKAARQAQDAQRTAEKYSIAGVAEQDNTRDQTQDEITKRYKTDVHGILSGSSTQKGALLVGYTPEIYRKLGMPDLPFVIGSGHVYSIAKTQDEAKTEGRFRKNVNYHGLGERAVADILQAVKNPVMVISAKDVDRNATPLRSTHSVVALVDVGTNGKSMVVPVSITAQSAVGGTVMDVNMISSAYERNASGLVDEAIAQFSSGESGIFYVTEKAATLAGEGVQFPRILQAAATSSDGIVRKFDSKINMSVKNVTQSQQFKRWFGDWQNHPKTASKVVNADGTPKVVYHQTGNDFTIFDVRKNGAGTRDNETPFGIFLKSSSRDIGLNGKKQMALYANIRNPLYARDRADLTRQLRELSPEYDAIRQEHTALDKEYKQKFEDAKKNFINFLTEWKKNHPGENSRSLYGTPEFERVFDAEDSVVEEWTSKADALSVRAKEVLTDALKQAGYDGVFLANDAGSWGRSTDAYIALSENQVKSATDNVGTFDRDNPDIRYSAAEAEAKEGEILTAEEAQREAAGTESDSAEDYETYESLTMDSMPKKAQDYLKRVQGRTAAAIQNTLSMPFAARQEVLKPALGQMMNEYLQTGRIAQETINKTFEESYAKGVELDTEFYDQYKDVKTRLRDMKVTLSEADRADIADFDDFRRSAFGRLRIANEGGVPVDTAYQTMREMAPELFPASVTHPADQLMKMFEVSKRIQKVERSLDEAHGENAEEFKRWAKNDYEASVEGMLGSLRTARRYAEARMRQKQARAVPTTQEEVTALWQELKKLRRTYERASAKNLMTAEDNNVLNRLLRGELAPEDVQGMENADGILAMYEAKADYDVAAAKLADWQRYREGRLLDEAQTDAVADAYGIRRDEIPRWAWGVTLNMMYSDYYPAAVGFGVDRPEFYAALAKAFLMDKDGPGPVEKIMEYYEHVVQG